MVDCGSGGEPSSSASTSVSPPSGSAGSPCGSGGSHLLIQVSDSVPAADEVLASKARIEQAPYDGIVLALHAGRAVFTTTTYATDLNKPVFDTDRADLPQINSARLTDNFLLMRSGAASNFDRFSDPHWATAIANISLFCPAGEAGQSQRGRPRP